MYRSKNGRLGFPIPYRILHGYTDGSVVLLLYGFVVSKEAYHECIIDRKVAFLGQNSGKVTGVVVDNFIDHHQLHLIVGWHTNFADFSINEMTDIYIISVLGVILVVTNVELALGLGSGFGFCNPLGELYLRRSTPELCWWSRLVDIRCHKDIIAVRHHGSRLKRWRT